MQLQYATVRDIVFSNPSSDASYRSGSSKQHNTHPKSTSYSLGIEMRKDEFFKKLAEVNPTAGILSLQFAILINLNSKVLQQGGFYENF